MISKSVNNLKKVTVQQLENLDWYKTPLTETINIPLHKAFLVVEKKSKKCKAFYLLINFQNYICGQIALEGKTDFYSFEKQVNEYLKTLNHEQENQKMDPKN